MSTRATVRFVALALALALGALGGDALAKKPKKEKPSAAPSAEVSAPAPAPAAAAAADDVPRATAPAPSKGTRRGGSGAAPGSARQVVQRESHIEFDERLVQGQTAAGAIYLFQRGESEFRSMVRMPESFRDRTVRPLLPPSPSAAAQR